MRKLRGPAALVISFSLASGWLIAAAGPAAAADPTVAPLAQGSHVVDAGGYMSAAGIARIDAFASRIESAGAGRIGVYTYDRMASSPSLGGLAAAWNIDGLLLLSDGTFGDIYVGGRLKARLTSEQLDVVNDYNAIDAPTPEAWVATMLARIDAFVGGRHVFDGAGVLDSAGMAQAEQAATDLGGRLGTSVYIDIAEAADKSPSTIAFFNGADLSSDLRSSLIIALGVSKTQIGGYLDTDNSDLWDKYVSNSPWSSSTMEDRNFDNGDGRATVLAAIAAVQQAPLFPLELIPFIIGVVAFVIAMFILPLKFGPWMINLIAGVTPPIKNGRSGDAVIESIGETGITVTMPSVGPDAPEYKFGLRVTPDDGGAAYHVDTKALVPRIFVPMMTPGAHVGVVIDPKNPQRVSMDFSRRGGTASGSGAGLDGGGFAPAFAGAGAGAGAAVGAALGAAVGAGAGAAVGAADSNGMDFQFGAAGRPLAGETDSLVNAVRSGALPQIPGSADRLLATGTHGTAVVTSCQPLGKRVREIDSSAPADRLNDPVWLFTLEVKLPGQDPFPALFGHRVPAAKAAEIGPGTKLAVAVDETNKNQDVAIDWNKSPLPG